MKKNVCILQNGLARGGTDTFVVNLCKSIDKEEFDVTVVNPSNKLGSLVREPELLSCGIKIVHTYPLTGLKGKGIHLWKLYKLLRKDCYDVFQTNIDLFNGPNLFVAWLAKVPIRCCHSHNTQQQAEVVKGRSLAIVLYQYVMRWMCWHFSNRRCGCSEDAMNFLYKGYQWKQERYPSIIYNGIDINAFRQADFNKIEKKQQMGLKAKYNILTVGQIVPQKNPTFIVDIFNAICKKRDDIYLVWVGVGYLENEIKTYIEKLGLSNRIVFLGRREDVPEIMRCCDLFLLPSLFEGLGIVLIEAQAAGLACLASDVVPSLANCGAIKYVSLIESADVWSENALETIEDKGNIKINEYLLQKFSISHMVEQMESVFNS